MSRPLKSAFEQRGAVDIVDMISNALGSISNITGRFYLANADHLDNRVSACSACSTRHTRTLITRPSSFTMKRIKAHTEPPRRYSSIRLPPAAWQ
jgi:hypothetical protein